MNVLIVGGGGREHALAWKIARSSRLERLYAAPGNPGIAALGECVPIKAVAFEELAAFAERQGINLTVVGPEAPLVGGIADVFEARGLAVFGPNREAAVVEGSKAFAKDLMAKYGIPTARYQSFTDPGAARSYAQKLGPPLVVKADGLAAGKGAVVCRDIPEAVEAIDRMMVKRLFGDAGAKVVVEEFLEGEEVSVFALSDGESILPLGVAQDHKAVFDGDLGPNTGGMGAYSPAPIVTPSLYGQIMERIMGPTVQAMAREGRPYRGLLYGGLILTADGPRVLEFNCRFGDPETQPLLCLFEDDLLALLETVAKRKKLPPSVSWKAEAAVCVVLASGGYPDRYETGRPITGIEAAEKLPGVQLFHAGTALKEGRLVTAAGRVLGVTALGADIPQAIERAYEATGMIHFEGMHYRRDVGGKALARLGEGARN